MKMYLVSWSTEKDRSGQRMIMIGGALYPVSMAREIAKEILDMIPVDASKKLGPRKRKQWEPRGDMAC